jgi:hypothetical protein
VSSLYTIVDAPQRSEQWFAARLRRVTSSRSADMLATNKDGKPSASRKNLMMALVLEHITGKPQESGYQSKAMQDGIDREPDAYAAYESWSGHMLTRTGFVSRNDVLAGCSLDGHYGDLEGIVEIKSPIPATHWEYLRTGKVPNDYLKQIVHSLWVTGAQWCDWVSFNPDFPLTAQLKVVRVVRDESVIDAYDQQLRAFLAEVDREVSAFQTVTNVGAVLREVVHG